MARTFDSRNREYPMAVQRLAAEQPACFGTQVAWLDWLDDSYRAALGDHAARSRMNRGIVPDYCSDCEHAYERRMTSEGRCAKAASAAAAARPGGGGGACHS